MCAKSRLTILCLIIFHQAISQPAITGFSPTSAAKGDTVIINGSNLNSSFVLVRFGGINAAQTIPVSATQIKAVVGYGGNGDVSVITAGGISQGLPGFTYISPITPNFSFTPGVHYAPAAIQFTDLSVAAQPITSWLWDFYDGSLSNANPLAPHFYPLGGNYEVKLMVTTATDTAAIMKLLQIFPITQIVLCPGGGDTLKITESAINTYQWQTSTDSVNFTSLSDNSNYSGTGTSKLVLTGMASSNYGRMYRCLVNGVNTVPRFTLRFENNWLGTINNDWNNPANWGCGQQPDGNTDVTIYTGPVVVTGNAICRTLYVLPGVSFTVATGGSLAITH